MCRFVFEYESAPYFVCTVKCDFFSQNEQVKRRLVEVAIVARGDLFPNFAAFQEVLLKVQHRNTDLSSQHFANFFLSFQSGGVIELMPENVVGCPGANVFVHPSGHVELRSTFDSLRRLFNEHCVVLLKLLLFQMTHTFVWQSSILSIGSIVSTKLNSARGTGSGIFHSR